MSEKVVSLLRQSSGDESVRAAGFGRDTYFRSDGVEFKKGDWLDTGVGVGKFAGCWDNPTLGWMTALHFYRRHVEPGERDTLWIWLGDPNQQNPLNHARKVNGPLTKKNRSAQVMQFGAEHQ